MIFFALGAMLVGVLCALFLFPPEICSTVGNAAAVLLGVLILSIGVDIGQNRAIFAEIRRKGLRILLIPLAGAVGSILPGTLAAMLCGYAWNIAAGISSGFGWYSLSAVLLAEKVSPEVGTVAFMVNVFRELLAILLIPLLARYVGRYTAIAPAGSTSMDTTLSFIRRYTDAETAVISVVNGVVLTSLVPVLVTFFVNL